MHSTQPPAPEARSIPTQLLNLAAPAKIKTRVYNLAGQRPFYSAGDLCDRMRNYLPSADLDFEIDARINDLLAGLARIDLDDGNARREWGWSPTFDLDGMIADFATTFKHMDADPK